MQQTCAIFCWGCTRSRSCRLRKWKSGIRSSPPGWSRLKGELEGLDPKPAVLEASGPFMTGVWEAEGGEEEEGVVGAECEGAAYKWPFH